MNHMSRRTLQATLAAIVASAAPTTIYAADSAMQDLLRVLHEKGTLDDNTYEELIGASKADDEHNTEGQAEIKQTAKSLPKIETKGKLEWATQDGDFSWRFGGRLHLDGTFYDNDDGTEARSGVDIRRARLEFQGTLYKHWMWKLDYEFGQTPEVKEGFRDAYVRYIGTGLGGNPLWVTAGQFKEFFGLEHQNSSNHMPFVERALVSRVFHDFAEASDGRRMGVAVQTSGNDLWTGALGFFGKNASGDSFDDQNDPIAIQGRATLSPIHTDGAALHFAFAGNWINLNAPERARFRARPEARIGATRFLDTGDIEGAKSVNRWGLETGGIWGPAWFQGEYLRTDVHRDSDGTATFDGWHADVGWVLTGESRHYDFFQGVFQNPKPHANFGSGGWGALELAARYSALDLSDIAQGIEGGAERNFSAGVNWFLNPTFALRFQWTKVLSIKGGDFNGETPSEFLMRAQAIW